MYPIAHPQQPAAEASRRQLFGGIAAAAVAATGIAAQTAHASTAPSAKPLKGKVAIVTGARNNQGRAYAVALAA